jgi:hypothetical protein
MMIYLLYHYIDLLVLNMIKRREWGEWDDCENSCGLGHFPIPYSAPGRCRSYNI